MNIENLGWYLEKLKKNLLHAGTTKYRKNYEKSINDFNKSEKTEKSNNNHEKKVTPEIIRPERRVPVHHHSTKYEKRKRHDNFRKLHLKEVKRNNVDAEIF